jgi:hypothetical protein
MVSRTMLETLAGRGGDDGGCDDMMRGLLQRGCEAKQFVRILAGSGLDGDKAGAANRQSARLVEHHGVRAGERLERATPFYQDAAAGRLGGAGDKCHGRREDQRTRRRRDEYGETPNWIT